MGSKNLKTHFSWIKAPHFTYLKLGSNDCTSLIDGCINL